MRLTWSQHLQTARAVGAVEFSQIGSALALMGMAMLMLAQDLQAGVGESSADPGSADPA